MSVFRIPLIGSGGSKNRCFNKRLFVYIFPVIFFSIILNIFKFLESKVKMEEGSVKLEIQEIRYDPTYLTVNIWVRSVKLRSLSQYFQLQTSEQCCVHRIFYWTYALFIIKIHCVGGLASGSHYQP